MPSTRELCEARQIPVTDAYPAPYYIASMCDGDLWPSAQLSASEADMIRSYIEFICTDFYGRASFEDFVQRWSGKHKPYALIAGHNTVTFLKRAGDDWAYRRCSWRTGPQFFPQPRTGSGRTVDLPTLLDVVLCGYGSLDEPRPNPKWEAWKAANPEVFATCPAA